ncbi:helix-turn-helix domain-containing protein [Phytomonospora sp. NPDC050363]|uniref:TetR/AcrR family transcriptional regulator n=1 Tax=Phytomonospora sp. NPDC050363 TaxID=3155642 RepID=UPI0033C20C13
MTGTWSRRRGRELVDAIHAAALEEVAEVGYGRLTMDGIAKRAETARTSLYRRWPSPAELLLDALAEAHPMERPAPGADDLRGDLIASLQLMVDWMLSPAGRAVQGIMSDPRRDPVLVRGLFERVFSAHGGTFTKTVLLHYARHGHFDEALVTPVVADIGEALVVKHAMDTGMPGPDVLAAIVEQAILPAIGLGPPRP